MSKYIESCNVELMVGEPIYPREAGSVAAEPENLVRKGKRERLLDVKNLRRRATSRLACKLEALIFSLEGRSLSNAAFASFYLDVETSADMIVKRMESIKANKNGISSNDSTLGSRWHKYKDGDNSSLRDLQFLSNKLGEAIFFLIEKEWSAIQEGNVDDVQYCLRYISGYDEWLSALSRYAYQIALADVMWANATLEKKFKCNEIALLNEIFFENEDFVSLLLGSPCEIDYLANMLNGFDGNYRGSANVTHDSILVFIKKALRVVNGEVAIVRWGRLLKENISSSPVVCFDISTKEKVDIIRLLLK